MIMATCVHAERAKKCCTCVDTENQHTCGARAAAPYFIFLLLASRRILAGSKLARRLKLGPLRRLGGAQSSVDTPQHTLIRSNTHLPVAGHLCYYSLTAFLDSARSRCDDGEPGKDPKIPDVGDRAGPPGASRPAEEDAALAALAGCLAAPLAERLARQRGPRPEEERLRPPAPRLVVARAAAGPLLRRGRGESQ